MLIDHLLFGDRDKVSDAIAEIRAHEPPEGYYVADSGGKDSSVVIDLVKRAGVKYQCYFHPTTVDPPELIRFIREHHPDTIFTKTKTTMWKLIVKKRMPPTRIVRYCCEAFKEGNGMGRIVVLGIRWQESNKRSKRKMLEACNKPKKNMVYFHPIISWTFDEVWEYIHKYKVPYCSLYDEGHKRIGCIMCPMSGPKGMKRDMERWPKYYQNYLRAFDKTIKNNKVDGKEYKRTFSNAQEMMDWWIGDNNKKFKSPSLFDIN